MIRKHSLKPLPKLKAKAWKIFSLYIRMRDGGVCFTCGKKDDPKNMQAGHFRHNKLDYSEMNVNCQCVHCNHFLSGNLGEYALRLIKKYGQEEVDRLVLEANTKGNHYSREELEEIIETYKEKINCLMGSKDLPF